MQGLGELILGLALLLPGLSKSATILGPRYGEIADVQAVMLLDPRPDRRVSGTFGL